MLNKKATLIINQLSLVTFASENLVRFQSGNTGKLFSEYPSIPQEYQNDPVASAYASDLEDVILKYKPAYLVHGHIHTPVRYRVDETEIICNPHGYINEKYNGYNKKLVIEV